MLLGLVLVEVWVSLECLASVTQHSVGGFNTDVSNMVGVTGNSNTGGMVSVSRVCDMGHG